MMVPSASGVGGIPASTQAIVSSTNATHAQARGADGDSTHECVAVSEGATRENLAPTNEQE